MTFATVLGWGSVAWACVPQANLVSLEPRSFGAPGTEVTVNGLGFDETAAEIRWNGPEGPLLAPAQGPNFSVSVTVPDEPDGLYSIVVINREPGGGVGSASATPFQVMSATSEGELSPRGSTAERASGDSGSSPSSEPAPVLLVLGGAGLFALGTAGGVRFGRRRAPSHVSEM